MMTPATHLPTRRPTHRRHQPTPVASQAKPKAAHLEITGFLRYDLAATLRMGADQVESQIGLICDDLNDGFPVEIRWFLPQQSSLDVNREAQWIRQLVQAAQHGSTRLRMVAGPDGLEPRAFLAATASLLPMTGNSTQPSLGPVDICLPLMGEEAALRLRTRSGGPTRILSTARSLHLAGWTVQLLPIVSHRFPGWKQDWQDSLALARQLVPTLVEHARLA